MDEETRVALLEIKASLAESRAANAEAREAVSRQLAELRDLVNVVIDGLVDFRAEYSDHLRAEGGE